MNIITPLLVGGIIVVTSFIVLYILKRIASDKRIRNAEKRSKDIVKSAERQAKDIVRKAESEGRSTASKLRREAEDEVRSKRQSVNDIENRVIKKEKQLDSKEDHLNTKEEHLDQDRERLKQLQKKEEAILVELSDRLETIAGLSKVDAEKRLMEAVERDCRKRAGRMIKDIEDKAKKIANRKAKEIITDAIQRTAVDHVAEATTSVVQLPDDELKGRVIGREGRNIRAFESTTGVDIIVDDTPGTVVLSAFDPIRREIARMALEKLVQDGRIHPTKIEEAVDRSRAELQEIILERGERAADELGLQFHPKIIEMMGKLHYRTSYGQNILSHSLESAHIAGVMASELGVNISLAKRGAMLHDIGKAIDFEQEGSHTDLGKDICEKYGESDEVINCIMAHHEDEDPDTIEAVIVMMADAISSVRPGARRESMDTYIKRLEKLEALANGFRGVEKAFAIQAGREVRVIVRPEEVDDDAAQKLAFDMAQRIEAELDYPGEVQVSVVRETRAVGIAH